MLRHLERFVSLRESLEAGSARYMRRSPSIQQRLLPIISWLSGWDRQSRSAYRTPFPHYLTRLDPPAHFPFIPSARHHLHLHNLYSFAAITKAMSIVHITRTDLADTPVDGDFQTLTATVRKTLGQRSLSLGNGIQTPASVQIVSKALPNGLEGLLRGVTSSGLEFKTFGVLLPDTPFQMGHYLASNIVECVQNYFPVSKATAEVRAQIVSDFARFFEPIQDAASSRGLPTAEHG